MSSIRITSAQAWIVAPIVAGMLAALPGCTDGQGNDIAQIICLFPDDGAAAMPRTVEVQVEVPPGMEQELPVLAQLESEDGDLVNLDCTASAAVGLVHCERAGQLEPDTLYTLSAEIAGIPESFVDGEFTTAPPTGAAYDLAPNVEVQRLGGSPIAGSLLDSLIGGDNPLLLVSEAVHDAEDLPSLGSHWVWGPGTNLVDPQGEPIEDTYAVLRDVGYPLSIKTQVDGEGAFFGRTDHAHLPIRVDGTWIAVRIDDVSLRGSVDPHDTGLPVVEFQVSALIPDISIDRVADELGSTEAFLLQTLVEYNVDADGDGTVDSALLTLGGSGLPTTIHVP